MKKLKLWFNALDIVEMEKLGYGVFEFDVKSIREVSPAEIVFTRENIISVKRIDPRGIWGEEYCNAKDWSAKHSQIN